MSVLKTCKQQGCQRVCPKYRSICTHHRYIFDRYGTYVRPPHARVMKRVTQTEVDDWMGMYMSGLNTIEIGQLVNRHPSLVHYHLKKRNVIRSKSEVKIGDINPMWVGFNVSYQALHAWVLRHKPKPKTCERCLEATPYDLANISQEYKRDVSDFEWLCRKCHMTKDGRLEKLVERNKSSNGSRIQTL